MKKDIILAAIGTVLLLLVAFFLVGRPGQGMEEPKKVVRQCNYSFAEFRVSELYKGKIASADFKTNPNAEEFKTAIAEASAKGPNFAGYYTVATWGCGTACQSSAIIDVRTGAIKAFGILSSHGLKFSMDSFLLAVNPEENLPEGNGIAKIDSATDYYQIKETGLEFLCKKPIGLKGSSYECDKEHVIAKNPLTGELKGLETFCDVPSGWDAALPSPEPGI